MSARTIGLWVVLIVLFTAFYQFFARAPGSAPPVEPGLSLTWMPMMFVVFFVVFFGFFAIRGRGANKLGIEGNSLLSAGRAYQALEKFQQALKVAPKSTVLRHNIGLANLYLWRVKEASESLRTSATSSGRLGLQDIRPVSRPILALSEALLDRCDLARQTLNSLEPATSANSPYALLAECVIACRGGNWAQAEAFANRPEVYHFGGFFRALCEALAAWAAQNLRGEKLKFNRVALYAEAGPDALRKIWPALADFAEQSS